MFAEGLRLLGNGVVRADPHVRRLGLLGTPEQSVPDPSGTALIRSAYDREPTERVRGRHRYRNREVTSP
jgi:hypothetical protein